MLLSRCAEFHRIAAILHRYTNKPIGIILNIGLLNELFKPKWSENLAGGLLESFGRLFKEGVTLHVFPGRTAAMASSSQRKPFTRRTTACTSTGISSPTDESSPSRARMISSCHSPDAMSAG